MTAYSSPEYISANISHFVAAAVYDALMIERIRLDSGRVVAAWAARRIYRLSLWESVQVLEWIGANIDPDATEFEA